MKRTSLNQTILPWRLSQGKVRNSMGRLTRSSLPSPLPSCCARIVVRIQVCGCAASGSFGRWRRGSGRAYRAYGGFDGALIIGLVDGDDAALQDGVELVALDA